MNKRPKNVPPAYWQRLEMLRYWAVLYVVVWCGYGVFYFFVSSNSIITLVFLILWGCLMLFFGYAPRRIDMRLRRQVLENRYRLCLHCGYSLRELPTQHHCPECGSEYTLSQVEHDWKEWYSESDS